jgi:hypothetical protein
MNIYMQERAAHWTPVDEFIYCVISMYPDQEQNMRKIKNHISIIEEMAQGGSAVQSSMFELDPSSDKYKAEYLKQKMTHDRGEAHVKAQSAKSAGAMVELRQEFMNFTEHVQNENVKVNVLADLQRGYDEERTRKAEKRARKAALLEDKKYLAVDRKILELQQQRDRQNGPLNGGVSNAQYDKGFLSGNAPSLPVYNAGNVPRMEWKGLVDRGAARVVMNDQGEPLLILNNGGEGHLMLKNGEVEMLKNGEAGQLMLN